jgi:hypothetical protein
MPTHISVRWSLAGLVSGLALFGFCLQAWSLPARYTLTPIGPVSPPECSLNNQAGCISPQAAAIDDNSTLVVGTVGNVDGNFTPTEFSPSTHALPGSLNL